MTSRWLQQGRAHEIHFPGTPPHLDGSLESESLSQAILLLCDIGDGVGDGLLNLVSFRSFLKFWSLPEPGSFYCPSLKEPPSSGGDVLLQRK